MRPHRGPSRKHLMGSGPVWNEDAVREMDEVRRDKDIPKAMFGRIFGILGIKHAELDVDNHVWKARIVIQGNNVHTKSGLQHPGQLLVLAVCALCCRSSRMVGFPSGCGAGLPAGAHRRRRADPDVGRTRSSMVASQLLRR